MGSDVIISVQTINKSFNARNKGLLSNLKKTDLKVYAVDNVSFELKKGEVLGIIGESGCGKSTTAKILLKLLDVDGGKIMFKGQDITNIKSKELKEYRKKVQIIFQDPYEYLNPRFRVIDIIGEPLVINKLIKNENEKKQEVLKYLEYVGLKPAEDYIFRYPHELSGGQRQRIAIARALIINPELVVADEPTSMLDVSVRADILNLLLGLKNKLGLSMVFITHDITTAGYMCDRIAVMYKGRVVEIGPKKEIIYNPKHPYTKALIGVAINLQSFLKEKDKFIKDGEIDSYVKSGYCSFEKRCICCSDDCRKEDNYELIKVGENHYVACCKYK